MRPQQSIQYFNLEYSVIGLPDSVKLLRPAVFKQDDQWCASCKTESGEHIIVYAETPEMAILVFDKKYKSKKAS